MLPWPSPALYTEYIHIVRAVYRWNEPLGRRHASLKSALSLPLEARLKTFAYRSMGLPIPILMSRQSRNPISPDTHTLLTPPDVEHTIARRDVSEPRVRSAYSGLSLERHISLFFLVLNAVNMARTNLPARIFYPCTPAIANVCSHPIDRTQAQQTHAVVQNLPSGRVERQTKLKSAPSGRGKRGQTYRASMISLSEPTIWRWSYDDERACTI